MFRLAHISDPHIGPLPAPTVRDLMGKRFFGYLSWKRRRQAMHRPEVLAALAEDIRSQQADHVAVTGDLINISLEAEFDLAAEWLKTLGPADRVSVVPGNHDAYVPLPWAASLAKWQAFMTGDAPTSVENDGLPNGTAFPFVRRRAGVALIGLSTAQPTPLFMASGALGSGQRHRLRGCLESLGDSGVCRIILIHHPPFGGNPSPRKHLKDAALFLETVHQSGAELILHGHDHRFNRQQIDAPGGPALICGVPSASARFEGRKPRAHYNCYAIERNGSGWQIGVTVRGYDAESHGFAETESYCVSLSRD